MPSTTSLSLLDHRHRSTGEHHQSLRAMQEAGTPLKIAQAHCADQEELESAVFFEVCKMGGLSQHPLGIIRVRPQDDGMVIQLLDKPFVIRHWAESLLPRCAWDEDEAGDPRDRIFGVYGLRWRKEHNGIRLHLAGTPTQLVLSGFNPRWWTRIADKLHTSSQVRFLDDRPGWTADETAAREAGRFEPPELGSAVLRHIRATAGDGPINSTSGWSSVDGSIRLETTDGPTCPQLIDLFCHPGGLSWHVERETCNCRSNRLHAGCVINFVLPGTQQFVYYSNLRWHRTLDSKKSARVAKLNAMAFSSP